MSHILTTSKVYLSLGVGGHLLEVAEGMPASQALDLAHDLAGGIAQLSERIHDGLNDGDTGYCAEIKALGFLGEVVEALTQSVRQKLMVQESEQ